MSHSRALCLLLLVAAFMPLHPKLALAETGYANFNPTQAQLSTVSDLAYLRCIEASGGVTASLNECSYGEADRLDRRLNVSYRSTLARLSRPKAMELRSGQRGWLASRYDKCEKDLESELGGSMHLMNLLSCQVEEVRRRIIWIETRR
jgi:uncharacterized protein YecT (DUF1311 family)